MIQWTTPTLRLTVRGADLTGGASLFAVEDTVGIFLVTSDGTITIDGLDYDG